MMRKRLQYDLGYMLIAVIVCTFGVMEVSAAFTLPGVIGHRGGGKAFDGGPENTVAGINRGFELGMVMAELDMQYSSDGVAEQLTEKDIEKLVEDAEDLFKSS